MNWLSKNSFEMEHLGQLFLMKFNFSIDVSQAHRNESFFQCCSGFCIDLLEKFAEPLGLLC